MKPQYHTRAVSLTRILALAGLLAIAPASQAQTEADTVPAEPPSVMPMFDADGDGWDDMWVSIYPELNHRDKTKDTDGDGISDHDEMLRGTNPLIANEPAVPPTPEELAEMERNAKIAEKGRKEAFAQKKAELAKFVVNPRRDADGKSITRKDRVIEERERLGAFVSDIATAQKAERQRALEAAHRQGVATRFEKDGRVSEVAGEFNGHLNFNVTLNVASAETISTDEVRTGGSLGLSLDGDGRIMGIWDGGDVQVSHTEFTSGGVRAIDKDGTSFPHNHATHVAGTMAAKGLNASAKGMSPQAILHTYDWNSDGAEMAAAALNDDLRVSNHSYGLKRGWDTISFDGITTYMAWWGIPSISATEDYLYGFYDSTARTVDQVAYNAPHYLSVWAAGNERGLSGVPGIPPSDGYFVFNGSSWAVFFNTRPNDFDNNGGYDLLEGRGVAKNNLTVTAVEDIAGGYTSPSDVVMASFSSWGPPDDGRIKPDLAANGTVVFSTITGNSYGTATPGGTSMAAPAVTGSLNLVLQHYENLFGSVDNLRASTVKALAIHTADEAGATAGPDYRFGWGLMNTKSAVSLVSSHHENASALTHVKQIVLENQDYIEFSVKALGTAPIKVTICWTDPAGSIPTPALDANVAALVNDLDLRVFQETTEHFPWKLNPASPTAAATNSGDNDRDTVEQVLIAEPVEGATYVVRVTHKGTLVNGSGAASHQVVSMVLTGIEAEPEPELKINEIARTGDEESTLVWDSVAGATYEVFTSTDLETWTAVPGELHATKDVTAAVVEWPESQPVKFWRHRRIE